MQLAEPVAAAWTATLALEFSAEHGRTVLAHKLHEGPLVVQKPFYPEGAGVCHAIVVHPPGGIAGGDDLKLQVAVRGGAAALLTTPGATKWYRSAGPLARQQVALRVDGALEWLPQEAIVFDGARAEAGLEADLAPNATLVGWDIVCLGRAGSGERYARGSYRFCTRVRRAGRLLWQERAQLGGGRLLDSRAGLGGHTVFGTLFASPCDLENGLISELRNSKPEDGEGSLTRLPGILLARYLGDSGEAARQYFTGLWQLLRPALLGREASEPRIWRT